MGELTAYLCAYESKQPIAAAINPNANTCLQWCYSGINPDLEGGARGSVTNAQRKAGSEIINRVPPALPKGYLQTELIDLNEIIRERSFSCTARQ